MKALTKMYFALTIIGLVVVYFWSKNFTPTDEEQYHSAINAYKTDKYSGVISNIYIDEEQNNFEKVIVNDGENEKVVLFNVETSGIFDFLDIGDSVRKAEGNLYLRVIRGDLDTILRMEFVEFP